MRRSSSILVCAGFVGLLYACVGDDPAPPGAAPGAGDAGGSSTSSGGGTSSGGTSSGSSSSSSSGDANDGGSDGGNDAAPACGAPGTPCCDDGGCNDGGVCQSGTCACAAPKQACGSTCVLLAQDPANCGRCGHSCVGGKCQTGVCQAFNLTTGPTTRELAIASDRVWITRSGNNFTKGGLYSAKLDGSGDVKTHVEYDLNKGRCSGLDIVNGKAYFICAPQPISAGTPKVLYSCDLPLCTAAPTPPTVVKSPLPERAGAVAADQGSGKVYFSVDTLYGETTGGGVFDSTGAAVSTPNQPNPVTLKAINGAVYWLNAGTYANAVDADRNGGVRRKGITPPSAETTLLLADNKYVDNRDMAIDASNIYYSGHNLITNEYDIVYAPITGGALTTFAKDIGFSSPLATDGENVYFSDGSAIRYCPRATGCSPSSKVLATNQEKITAIVTDATSVVWACETGEIRRIARP